MRGTLEHISANTKCSAALLLKQMGRASSSGFGNFNITSLILGDAFHLPFLSSCTLLFLKYCSMLGNNVTNVHILTPGVHAYYCTICHIIAILPSFQKIKKAKLKPSFYPPQFYALPSTGRGMWLWEWHLTFPNMFLYFYLICLYP